MSPGTRVLEVLEKSAGRAYLPSTYVAARDALIRCEQVDECQDWANKAAAVEVYARQAKDDSLVIMAQRIQARAIRRCGELLKGIPHRHGTGSGDGPTRTSVGAAAGMSRLQRRQAAQVAQIPTSEFERLVESKNPPKVYRLAQIGVRKRTKPTEQSLRRNLALAEAQVVRRQDQLQKAVERVESLRRQLAPFQENQRK